MTSQPVGANASSRAVLGCYGEKTINGQRYSKLILFIDSGENCFYFTSYGDEKIVTVESTEYAYSEADNELRDAYRDVASYSTTREKLEEAVIGLVPGTV